MRIKELKLFTDNLTKQKKFYSDILGLEIINGDKNLFSVNIGSSNLSFINNNTCNNPYYHFAINIPENQIEIATGWLKNKDIPLIAHENSEIIHFPGWNAHSVYFYDPAGNIIEFIARHNLPNKLDFPFDASKMQCISEVGIPVENVGLFCKSLKDKFREKLWSGNYKAFAAMGDENGLFIVVTPNRNWYPTDKPSTPYPLEVKLDYYQKKKTEMNYEVYKISAL
ncbi:MAG TPA: glyoxalase/bleomycin resistance/dioxygenase family protein [Ignavibacteria bacterium]